jgi:hypothetical protein
MTPGKDGERKILRRDHGGIGDPTDLLKVEDKVFGREGDFLTVGS